MDNERRHEKSWNDPPLFSMEQLNKASSTVPLSKRYRYPQAPVQAPNQMYQQQQQPNAGYGYPSQSAPGAQPGTLQQQPYGQQPQPQPQQYPTTYSPYAPAQNATAAPGPTNYQLPPSGSQPQQYSQFTPSQPLMAPNAAYPSVPGAPSYGNNASQPNYNPGQYSTNPASYNAASQYAGQVPAQQPQPNANYQSQQPYNPQARY